MSFGELVKELEVKAKEGYEELVVNIDGRKNYLGSIQNNIECFKNIQWFVLNSIDISDLFIVNGENGQVIITDNVPF